MTNNEILTLVLSSFAVIISFIGTYFQFFRKHTKANCRLVRISYPQDEYDMVLSYVIGNFGNLDLLLNDVEFVSGQSDKGTGVEPYSVLEYKCDNFPLIIEPGKIKQVYIGIKSKVFDNRENNKNNLYTMFEFVSTSGKKNEFLHDITHLKEFNSKNENKTWKLIELNKFNE